MSKKEKRTETSQATAVTQANTPSWISSTHQNYLNGVNGLMGQGAAAFTPAGPNQLQQTAFNNAQNLSASPYFDVAAQLGMKAGTAGANTAGPAAQATANGYMAAGPAGGQGYTASGPVAVNGYTPVNASSQGYNAQSASSRDFTDVDLTKYLSPFLGGMVDTAAADFDAQAGRTRAQQAAQSVYSGGARNANNSIMEAVTEGELARARNSGLAAIRSDAYGKASGLAAGDLDRSAQVSMFNANAANTASQFGAGAANQAALVNAGAQNSALAQLLGLQTQAGLDYAGRQDAAGQFGAQAANQSAMDYAGRADAAGQFGAAAGNAASQFNAGQANNMAQFNAGQQDAEILRQLQAAGLLANIGSAAGSDQRANIAAQSDLGQQQYQLDLMRQQYPLQYAQIMQSLSGFNPALYAGGTTNSSGSSTSTSKTSDPLGSLGALMQGAGTLFSPIKIPGFG